MAMVKLGGLQDLQSYFTNPPPTPATPSAPTTDTLSTVAKPSALSQPSSTYTPPSSGSTFQTFDATPPDGTQPPTSQAPTHQENPLTQWARPQLQSAYRKYLGRDISDEEFWNYLGPQASTKSIQQVLEAVRTSPESAAYQQSHPQQWGQEPTAPTQPNTGSTNTNTGGNGDYAGFGKLWVESGGKTAQDLAALVSAHPEYGAEIFGPKGNKVKIGGRYFKAISQTSDPLHAGNLWQDITNGEGDGANTNTSGNYSNDPSTTLLINTILQRLEQLQHPVADPMSDLYSLLGLNRIASLGGQPYTGGEDAALQAQYMNPLTEARDAAKQQAAERLSARGIGPTSGLFQKTMTDIDAGYERGVASASNARGVQAVQEKQRRADEQLAILHDLVSQGSTSRAEQESRWRELLSTTALLPGIDEDRLKLLLAASGDGASSPSSVLGTLASLQQANTNATSVANANSQANSGTWGAIIGYILNNLPK